MRGRGANAHTRACISCHLIRKPGLSWAMEATDLVRMLATHQANVQVSLFEVWSQDFNLALLWYLAKIIVQIFNK